MISHHWFEARHGEKILSYKQHFGRSTTCIYNALKEKNNHFQGNYGSVSMSKKH